MLREAAERAEAASRAKSEFLATMSHELRTPLNAVIGFSDILASEVLGPHSSPQYKEYAGDILTSGRRLLSVVNDILLLVKTESGSLPLDIDEVDIEHLVERCADSVSEMFDEAQVSFETGPHAPGCMVMADELRLRQVIMNLLSNASKFTPAGGKVRLVIDRCPDGRISIAVSDSGIGMKPEDIEIALSAFGQVDGGRSRKYEGAGLGLTLAKAIVVLHGGEMRLASEPEVGTVVTVLLAAPKAASGSPYLAMAS